jgi:ferritin-like metal-binding protein YciE
MAAAEAAGDSETARICQQILPQEEAMAAFLAEQLPQVTRQFLQRSESGATAKH